MNEIKVTVTYEKPTTSKFDALMNEYVAAKKYADETVSYYRPLADMAEDAKMTAILEQIEPIKKYAERLAHLKQCGYADIKASSPHPRFPRDFVVSYSKTGGHKITWGSSRFDHDYFHQYPHVFTTYSDNILGCWDQWQMYQQLEDSAIRQLKKEIDAQNERVQKEIDRLNNITKGGK